MKKQKRRPYRLRHLKRLRLQPAWLTPSVIRAFTNALEQMSRACIIYAATLRVVRHPHFPSGGVMRPAPTSSGMGAEFVTVDENAEVLKLTECLNVLSDGRGPMRQTWVFPPSSTTAE